MITDDHKHFTSKHHKQFVYNHLDNDEVIDDEFLSQMTEERIDAWRTYFRQKYILEDNVDADVICLDVSSSVMEKVHREMNVETLVNAKSADGGDESKNRSFKWNELKAFLFGFHGRRSYASYAFLAVLLISMSSLTFFFPEVEDSPVINGLSQNVVGLDRTSTNLADIDGRLSKFYIMYGAYNQSSPLHQLVAYEQVLDR